MKQLVRQRTAHLAQPGLVETEQVGVFVTLAQGLALVLGIERARTQLAEVLHVRARLAAAADAPARTAHDLDEVVGRLALCDLAHQPVRARQAGGDGHPHLHALQMAVGGQCVPEGHGRGLDLLQPFNGGHVQVFKGQLAARHQLAHGAQGGLHHAAGHAEDVRRARGQAQRRVERPLRQRAGRCRRI